MLTRVKDMLKPSPKPSVRPEDVEPLMGDIDDLTRENRSSREMERERRLVELRQLAGTAMTMRNGGRRDLVEPDFDSLPQDTNLPEVPGSELTPELIRAAILRHGAILVRGLVEREAALRLAEEIDQAFEARDALAESVDWTNRGLRVSSEDGYFEEMEPVPPHDAIGERFHVAAGGGLLAADSPKVMFEMVELFEQAGIRDLVAGYLREQPTISAHKTTLRRADPSVAGAWHQDGKFLGDVNTLNLWLSLSRCGDEAPGMDLVPRRLDDIVDAGDGGVSFHEIVVKHELAEELASEAGGILRPIFEPGDAMFFDHLYLHQTASDPSMPNRRYAVESWFFGPSAFPGDYIPLAY